MNIIWYRILQVYKKNGKAAFNKATYAWRTSRSTEGRVLFSEQNPEFQHNYCLRKQYRSAQNFYAYFYPSLKEYRI
jgi:hypothetical protein